MKQGVFRLLAGVATVIVTITADGKNADCSVARDPRRCEAKQAVSEACHDLQGQARSACMREALPPPDCSRLPNTAECQSGLAAAEACKDKRGRVNRRCLRKKTANH